MGTVTVTPKRRWFEGANKKAVSADITFSASYATNGDTIADADIVALLDQKVADLSVIDLFTAEIALADGTEAALDRTNKKIKAYSGRAEVANATNLSAAVFRAVFVYGDSPSKNV